MKSKMLQIIIIISTVFSISLPAAAQMKRIYIGSWNFECTLAPEGFNKGRIDIQNDSIFTTYSSKIDRFPSLWVNTDGDTIIYIVEVNGENVLYRFCSAGKDRLTGTAETPLGTSLLVLTKKEESWKENSKMKNTGLLIGLHENQLIDTSAHIYNIWHW
jgi:hypothetical protein